ncbi:hypothetical protein F5887DRAFT_340387 [Amanita rubescens]|nr:hypothetical protein F5887DRAFT_340387 [Amanita rubescens]
MIPKVATHILHTTSRAAAAVHNQTSTLRNVFQLQTSSGTSTAAGTGPWNGNGSSSRGNSHGPGPGGQKQNTGSRFYAGFTGPVRAVTQANAVTSQDGTFVQNDDNQEEQAVPPRRVSLRASKGRRIRSSSLSSLLGPRTRHHCPRPRRALCLPDPRIRLRLQRPPQGHVESQSHAELPDAVAYEATINTLVVHKRTDLIPQYITGMQAQGVKMTAYIANFFIRGYANVGDFGASDGDL